MEQIQVTLIAFDIRKWDLDTQRLVMNSYVVMNDEEKSQNFELSITQPPEMVEEYLGKIRMTSVKQIEKETAESNPEIEIANETFLQQKLYNYFKKVLSELNNPKRKKGSSRFIYSTHLDVYNEIQDISFLPQVIQFFVVLNWARKYYEKEDYQKAVEPLRKLVQIKPDFGLGYKWLARSLKKTRKYEDAMSYYEKYAEVDDSLDSWLDLAKSYRKGKEFDKSEEIYKKILKKDRDEREAKIGLAQIDYARNDPKYMEKLRELHKSDPVWLKEWLQKEFNYRIYVTPKTSLPPVMASQYLGFPKVFDLTQKAFKNEVPSHFNPSRAQMTFYKEELDNWYQVVSEFNVLNQPIELHPEKLDMNVLRKVDTLDEEEKKQAEEKAAVPVKPAKPKKRSMKLEAILRQIREAKAKRMEKLEAAKQQEAKAVAERAKSGPVKTAEIESESDKASTASKPKKSGKTKRTKAKVSGTAKKNTAEEAEKPVKKRTRSAKKIKKAEKPGANTAELMELPTEEEFLIDGGK